MNQYHHMEILQGDLYYIIDAYDFNPLCVFLYIIMIQNIQQKMFTNDQKARIWCFSMACTFSKPKSN
jgi:hypothetical protein